MPMLFRDVFRDALAFVGAVDQVNGRRVGFDEALELAEFVFGDGPLPASVSAEENGKLYDLKVWDHTDQESMRPRGGGGC